MKLLGLVIAALLASSAWADFSGKWAGKINIKNAKNETKQCYLWLELGKAPQQLTLAGTLECDGKRDSAGPINIEIRGHQLYLEGNRRIGRLTTTQMLIDASEEGLGRATANIGLTGNRMNLNLLLYDKDAKLNSTVTGHLARKHFFY